MDINININSDLAKLATTASVLVNSAAGNTSINDMLQKNKAFTSTFDSGTRHRGNGGSGTGNGEVHSHNGLIGLLAKHEDNLRIAKTLKRSNFTGNGNKKKDFNVLSNDMLNDIPDLADLGSMGELGLENDASVNNEALKMTKEVESTPFSLFQGFSAVLPEVDETILNIKKMSGKMIEQGSRNGKPDNGRSAASAYKFRKMEEITLEKIKSCQNRRILNGYKSDVNYHLDMIEIRKGLGNSEINEIDSKIDRLFLRRKEIADNIQIYEEMEISLEEKLLEIKDRLDFIKDISVFDNGENEDEDETNFSSTGEEQSKAVNNRNTNSSHAVNNKGSDDNDLNEKHKKIRKPNSQKNITKSKTKKAMQAGDDQSFDLDEEDEDYVNVNLDEDPEYTRVTSSVKRKFKPGDVIHEFQAHNDYINCIALDKPYGRMLTCSLDNTVRLWDMNRYKCVGLLEGHYASVECVSISDSFAFTGSHDASVKMWNLDYFNSTSKDTNDDIDAHPLVNSFEGHMDTVTALSYNNGELISGSNDKTIRQWDLNTGHLLQTMDIMWASSMANSMINFGNEPGSRKTSANFGSNAAMVNQNSALNAGSTGTNYPFISSLQVFDAALASGTNDGIVRLWDLRSGEVIRQLFGHTGPVTTLQFDKSFTLMTGSADRSIRIWDLRNGGLLDSFSYDTAIRKVQFDDKKIVSVCENDSKVHVYDRSEERHWTLGGADSDNEGNSAFDPITDSVFEGGYLVSASAAGRVSVLGV